VVFSEVSPRPHDTGMVTMATQDQSEFELHVRAILGLPIVQVIQRAPGASAVILAERAGHNPRFLGLSKALRTPREGPPVRQARHPQVPPHGRGHHVRRFGRRRPRTGPRRGGV
jgi:formate-dependent phosphoribosylglycinamide formyltransferase (GAR transformylase)